MDLTTTFPKSVFLFQASINHKQLRKAIQNKQQLSLLWQILGLHWIYHQNRKVNQHGQEYTVCYQPKLYSAIYNSATAKITRDSKETINPTGYCNLADSDSNHFISDRKIIATQLSFVRLNPAQQQALELKKPEEKTKTHTATPFSFSQDKT